MNIDELVYDLKEHLDTYCQTYDDYELTYNQTEMIYYLIKKLEKENKKYKEIIEKTTWYLNLFISDENLSKYDILKILMHVKKILKEVEHDGNLENY